MEETTYSVLYVEADAGMKSAYEGSDLKLANHAYAEYARYFDAFLRRTTKRPNGLNSIETLRTNRPAVPYGGPLA